MHLQRLLGGDGGAEARAGADSHVIAATLRAVEAREISRAARRRRRALPPAPSASRSSSRARSRRSRRPLTSVYSPSARGDREAVHDVLAECRSCRRTGCPSSPTCRCCRAIQSRTWSMAALAADAADDRPRASMIAAPRLPTVGRNTLRFQSSSLISVLDRLAVDGGEAVVGVHRRRVVAPDDQLLDRRRPACRSSAASCDSARLWSRRSIAVKFFAGSDGADFIAM